MLPDISHFIVILINSRLPNCVPEERFKGPRAASSHNHSIQPLFLRYVGNFFGGVRSARKELLLSMDNIR